MVIDMWDTERKKILDKSCGQHITNYNIRSIQDNYIVYEDNYKYGLMSLTTKNGHGNIITKPIFKELIRFVNGYASVRTENGAGVIDLEGNMIIPDTYRTITGPTHNNVFIYELDNEYMGLIGIDNKIITKPLYYRISHLGGDLYLTYDKEEKKGIIDSKGNEIIKPMYKNIKVLNSNLFKVKIFAKKELYNIINRKGELINNKPYESINKFDDNTFFAHYNNKGYILDRTGKVVKKIKVSINRIGPVTNSLLRYATIDLFKNITYGVLNKKGEKLIEADDVWVNDKLLKFLKYYKKEQSVGVLNDEGQVLYEGNVPFNYTYYDISFLKHNFFAVKNTLYNDQKEKIADNHHVQVFDDVIFMNIKDKCFLCDLKGNPLSEKTYDNIYYIDKNLYKAYETNSIGVSIINNQAKTIIEPQEHVEDIAIINDVIKIKYIEDGNISYSLYDLKGNILIDKINDVANMHILNSESVIINNYLYKFENIKYKYLFRIFNEKYSIDKEFDSLEKQDKYLEHFLGIVIPKIDERKKKYIEELKDLKHQFNQYIANIIEVEQDNQKKLK